jgi:aryl-alcohol dehydrogenase-like predicted oxidoreductase
VTRPAGTIQIAGVAVSRLGLGTMGLTGPGHWGAPVGDAARRVLQEAVHDHGITHLDTADAYGPAVAEEQIRSALHPYPASLLIATKVGMVRPGPNQWKPLGRPDYLRAAVEASLRRLGVDRLQLCYLHRIDPQVPLADQLGALRELQVEGKIAHIGISKVTVDDLGAASALVDVAAVQNVLNVDEPDDPVVAVCQQRGIPYVPYRPLNAGTLPADKALTWLLGLGDHIAPIPGTSSPEHLRELVAAARQQEGT